MRRQLRAFLASTAVGLLAGRPIQTALQPAPVQPTGRVCALHSFAGPGLFAEPALFNNPGAIAVGSDSNLYTTSQGGGKNGLGAIVRLTPSGEVKTLFDFDRTLGASPQSGLVLGPDGYLYGTTYAGGHLGVGTLFRILPTGSKPEILWHFRNGNVTRLLPEPCGKPICPYTPRQRADISAAYPVAPPVVLPGGIVYGVTQYSNNQGFGVLYTTRPPYDSTSFHALCIFDQRMLADPEMKPFVCKAPGSFPGALIANAGGTELYGTTHGGNGTVYRASLSGDMTTLHTFDLTGGAKPYNLLLASNGRLYGTTANGGDTGGGTIWTMETSGAGFRVMSSFRVNSWLQGLNPVGGLVEARPPGNIETFLYGTTKYGGAAGRGTIFRIPLTGDSLSLRVMHDFDMWYTGRSPVVTPVIGKGGRLYGLTYQGGSYDYSALWSMSTTKLMDQNFHDAYITGGTPAKDDKGVYISDPMVKVWTNAVASQTGVDARGKTVTSQVLGGIRVQGNCGNPHMVQFLYRENLTPLGYRLPGTIASVSGTYDLTTHPDTIHWNTDIVRKQFEAGRGLYDELNAYFDQSVGAGHTRAANYVVIFDKPSFGEFQGEAGASDLFPPSGQDALNPALSQTWRATARDFLICNCQVAKEIWWTREVKGGKASYTHIRVETPADPAASLRWINEQLNKNGYAAIP